MKVTVSTDNSELNKTFARYVREVGADIPTALRQTARLACVEMAFRTQPYGKSSQVHAKGKGAVASDIKKLYRGPGVAYEQIQKLDSAAARAFWHAVKSGDVTTARKVLKSLGLPDLKSWDSGALHVASRNRRGRAVGKSPAMSPAAMKRVPSYIRKQQRLVGHVKSGFATCARSLGGTRGIPGWVSRNRGRGRVLDNSRRRVNPSILIENLVGYLGAQLSPAHYAAALQVVSRNLGKSIDKILAHRARKNRMT